MTTPVLTLPAGQAARALTVLSHPGLIRLVTEIDDNGPVHRRLLGRTFSDLPRHQVRSALEIARAHQLLRTGHGSEPCYALTARGSDLADVYDTLARWARAQQAPAPASDFLTRVQHTLALLRHGLLVSTAIDSTAGPHQAPHAVESPLLPDEVPSLHRPREVVSAWLSANPSLLVGLTRRFSAGAQGESVR
ncbi:regulator [Streptomyces sp. NPDC021100]|uniref:regulator n=1 Tax=Streptomyces sp. NPDC021100 TaxID=3365114 RepID=UPI0037ACF75F